MLIGIIVVLLFILLIIYYKNLSKFPKNIPPGPLRIPGFGNLFQLAALHRKRPYDAIHELSKKYGPITFLQIGVTHQILIEDYNLIKEVLTDDVWVDRVYSDWIAQRSFGKILGIVMISGDVWKEMRRFSVRTLRDFGFGKQKSMELSLQEELTELIQRLENRYMDKGEGVIYMKQFFTVSVLNILWHMIAGFRFCHDDVKLRELLVKIDNELKTNTIGSLDSPMYLYTAFPFLAKFAPYLSSSRVSIQKDATGKLHTFLRKILEERRAEGSYQEQQRDYIDVFLREIDAHKYDPPETNFYTDEQFIVVTMDLFMAGSETTSNTIEFGVRYLIEHQDAQRSMQKEIDEIIGPNRLPCISDIPNMPYIEATILEIQRFANVLPIIIRAATRETTLGGYTIPQKSVAVMNVNAMHMDKKSWGDPLKFRPERFLNTEHTQVIDADKIIPFGAGKRECIGRQLAKASLFMYMTTILQKFTFEESPENPLPSINPVLGFTLAPNPYHALIKQRLHKY